MVATINAKQFVKWLFSLPTKRKMKPLRADDAFAVARRLFQLAHAHPEDRDTNLESLAQAIWMLPLHRAEGKVASSDRCESFLQEFSPYLLGHDIQHAQTLLSRTDQPGSLYKPSGGLEYRTPDPVLFAPMAAYVPRQQRKPPQDDVSERICIALDAMKSADCGKPAASVAEALRDSGLVESAYCTSQHVKSRVKRFPKLVPLLTQEANPWLHGYWNTLHPESAGMGAEGSAWPERFTFEKCDC